ncbi:MAG: hypothetical protein ACREIA_20550 [Opitutaceae bacterium]
MNAYLGRLRTTAAAHAGCVASYGVSLEAFRATFARLRRETLEAQGPMLFGLFGDRADLVACHLRTVRAIDEALQKVGALPIRLAARHAHRDRGDEQGRAPARKPGEVAWQALSKSINYGSALTDAAEQTRTSVEGFQVFAARGSRCGREPGAVAAGLAQSEHQRRDRGAGQHGDWCASSRRSISTSRNLSACPLSGRWRNSVGGGFVNASDQSSALLAITRILGEEAGPG